MTLLHYVVSKPIAHSFKMTQRGLRRCKDTYFPSNKSKNFKKNVFRLLIWAKITQILPLI